VYYHGGGYFAGGIVMHRNAMDYLVRDLDCPILFVEYGLIPENTHANLLAQCEGAFVHLLKLGTECFFFCIFISYDAHSHAGVASHSVAFVGDSAGGGISLLVAQALRDKGAALPAAVACLSPWLDLSLSGMRRLYLALEFIVFFSSFNPCCF
jgi:acetyl esterase/lipase